MKTIAMTAATFRRQTAATSIALVAVGILYVWTHLRVVDLGYLISDLLGKRRHVQADHDELALERDTLLSPKLLESKAINDFQLRIPRRDQVIWMQDNLTKSP